MKKSYYAPIFLVLALTLLAYFAFHSPPKESFKDIYPTIDRRGGGIFEHELVGRFARWANERGKKERRHDKPHVIFISLDTLRADHLGAYGYGRDTSPYMDKLAEYGIRFANVISQAPKTLPSHMTMFTGLYPSVHGAHLELSVDSPKAFTLSGEISTLPQWFKAAGYRTAAWTGGGQMAPEAGFGKGFDVFNDGVYRFIGPEGFASVVNWFKSNADRPCFIFLHTYQIHTPYIPPKPYNELFDPHYNGWIISDWAKLADIIKRKDISLDEAFWGGHYGLAGKDMGIKNDGAFSPTDVKRLAALYDGDIRYTDAKLMKFINDLIREGLMDNTVLVITADHGEEFMEHGGFLHRKLYREILHAPLIIFYPRRLPLGVVVDERARLIDLPATILSVAGLPIPPQLSGGVDLTSLVGKPRGGGLPAYSEEPWLFDTYHRSFRDGNFVLYDKGAAGAELYDMAEDPRELNDISETNAQLVEKLTKKLKVFINGNAFKRKYPNPTLTPVLHERLKELRNLGYIK